MWALAAVLAAQVGTNVHLPPSDTLDLAQELGAGWIRIDFNWDLAEPTDGAYNWAPFDAVIDAAAARGLSVYATIGYCPAWASASGDRAGDGPMNDVPDAAAYQQFVTDAAARYADGRVTVWGTWNEPNLGDFFEGTKDEWIANAFGPAVDGIRAGCPACLVAGPEVATIGDLYDDYLQAALAARTVDLISGHIYAAFPEDDSAAGTTKDSFYNKLEAHRSFPPIFEGPLSLREVAVMQGAGDIPMWITETGREAAPGATTDLEAQRLYTQRILDAMESRPWWAGTIIYELSEEHPGGLWPDIHWGLALRVADPDGTYSDNFDRKPAFDYLKMRLAAPPPGPDAGAPTGDGGTPSPADGGGPGSPDAGIPVDDGDGASGGCGCSVAPRTRTKAGAAAAVLLLLSLCLVRRSARRR